MIPYRYNWYRYSTGTSGTGTGVDMYQDPRRILREESECVHIHTDSSVYTRTDFSEIVGPGNPGQTLRGSEEA